MIKELYLCENEKGLKGSTLFTDILIYIFSSKNIKVQNILCKEKQCIEQYKSIFQIF